MYNLLKKGFKMKKLVAVASLLFSSQVFAFDVEPVMEDEYVIDGQWEWSMTAFNTSFDDSVLAEGIETSALGFGVDVDYIQNNWITTMSAEYMSYKDNDSFSEYVVGDGWSNKGDVSTEGSDAAGLLIGVATGYMHFLGEDNDVAVIGQVGMNFMAYSERSILLCEDCYSEDIDMDGGLFLKAGIVKDTGSFNLGIYAKTYLSGDSMGTTFGISVGSSY